LTVTPFGASAWAPGAVTAAFRGGSGSAAAARSGRRAASYNPATMRSSLLALLALLAVTPQDSRKKFDEFVQQLEDDSLEAREKAAAGMAGLPAEADAWIEEAIKKAASSERRAQLQAVLGERKLRIEIGRFLKLGLSEPFLRAHRDFGARAASDDSAVRIALLEEITGVRLDPDSDDPGDAEENTVPGAASAREAAIVLGLCLEKPASRRLQCEVLAVIAAQPHPADLGVIRTLLRESAEKIREYTIHAMRDLRFDFTPAVPEILKVLEEGDRAITHLAASHLIEVDWTPHLDALLASLPKMGEETREMAIDLAAEAISARFEAKIRPLLASPEAALRRLAAEYYATHRLVRPEGLTRLLDDADESTRRAAFRALIRTVPKEKLLAAAGAEDVKDALRVAAIEELARRRLPEAKEILHKELDRQIPGTAARILAFGDEAFIAELSDELERSPFGERLAYVNWLRVRPVESAVPILKRILKAADRKEVATAAARAYAEMAGDAAVADLVEMVESGGPAAKSGSASALAGLRGPGAQKAVLKLFVEKPDLRSQLFGAVYSQDEPRFVEKLLELGFEPPLDDCLLWIFRSAAYGTDSPKLREGLASDAPGARAAVMLGLARVGTPDAREAVLKTMKALLDQDFMAALWKIGPDLPGFRERATEALKGLKDSTLANLEERLAAAGDRSAAERIARRAMAVDDFDSSVPVSLLAPDLRKAYVEAALAWARLLRPRDRLWLLDDLMSDGVEEAVDTTWTLTLNSAEGVDSQEASYLVDGPPPRLRELARPLLASAVEAERQLAAYVLGRVGDESDRPRIRALLKDPCAGVRESAATAAGELEDREAAAMLVALLSDPEPDVRSAALSSLEDLAAGPLDALKAACADTGLRPMAIRARAVQGDLSAAEEFLKGIAAGANEGNRRALTTLAKAGSKPVLAFLKERAGKDATCDSILAELGDADAIDRLKRSASVESATALLAIGRLDDPGPVLERLAWVPASTVDAFLVALNRAVDATRCDALAKRWTASRWVGAARADLAAALTEALGVPVKADASVPERHAPFVLDRGAAWGVIEGAVPVFEGEGITLYGYHEARAIWTKRLKR